MGKQKPFKGIIEPRLGIIESLWLIIEPLLGITKPAEGINKPHLGGFVITSAASEAKTSIIARTPAKAVDSLYARICLRTIRHSPHVRKKSKNECRFNYPQPTMRATEIPYPLKNIHHHVK